MTEKTVRTLRISSDVAREVDDEADRLGITFTDFMVHAAQLALGRNGDPAIDFLKSLSRWIEKTYDKTFFPADVTLQVFHHIRDDAQFRHQYDALTTTETGEKDWDAVISLHRRIGRMVKRVLNARVVARSLPLDPEEHLIKTHALLAPRSSERNKEGTAEPGGAGRDS